MRNFVVMVSFICIVFFFFYIISFLFFSLFITILCPCTIPTHTYTPNLWTTPFEAFEFWFVVFYICFFFFLLKREHKNANEMILSHTLHCWWENIMVQWRFLFFTLYFVCVSASNVTNTSMKHFINSDDRHKKKTKATAPQMMWIAYIRNNNNHNSAEIERKKQKKSQHTFITLRLWCIHKNYCVLALVCSLFPEPVSFTNWSKRFISTWCTNDLHNLNIQINVLFAWK